MNWLPLIIVSIQVSLIAAVGLLATSLLRSAAHRHIVLLASLVCILASPMFYAGAAWLGITVNLPVLFPARETGKAAPVPTVSNSAGQEHGLATLPEGPREFAGDANQESTVFPAETTLAPASANSRQPKLVSPSPLPDGFVVAVLWLIGTLFSLTGVLRSHLRAERILKAARPVAQGIDARVIAEAEKRLNAVGGLRIATTGKVAGPAVVGVFQPWILMPARYLETLSRDELLQVLIHEGAHALRRDPLVALLQRFGGALFWWHPLVHLVNRNLTRAREEVCDNFVLSNTEPETYGSTLLRLATLSPAMARLPLAIGMFDGRGKLEDRIRRLLDTRRIVLTRVRFVTRVAVLCVFALLSVIVAATRVGAQNPGDAPAGSSRIAENEREATPAEAVDVKDFRLILTYHGESDKPFYNLVLNVPPEAQRAKPFSLAQQISEGQARKLIKNLKESQFFEHAKVTKTQDDPTTGPQYLLRVRLGESHFEETLGWDLGTLVRLEGLRKALEPDAAKLMDQLLARLGGQRKAWESGEIVDDLKTKLSAEKNTFISGQPIPIKLELTNLGQQDRQYGHHLFIRSGSEIVVTDEHGRQVPYLGGGAGLEQRSTTLKPGETKVIESCDLSNFYYLRRPGLYTVAFHNVAVFKPGVPSSNALRFRVTAAEVPATDGDPMGKLLPLVSANFGMVGSPNAKGKVRPGCNRQETPGWQFILVGPGGLKMSKATVWLWLTDEAAKEVEPPKNDYLPPSEYLGMVARWHVYLHAPPEALKLWPAVKQDLKNALAVEVLANPAGAALDGDPLGRLLPLVKEGWEIGVSPGPKLKLKPGSNWGETTGHAVRFVRNPPVYKGDGLINLWLADEPAAATPVESNSSIPTSEYLGKISRWHVYFLASESALKAWPTAKEDIRLALDLGWSEAVADLKARLSVETKEVVQGATLLNVYLELQNASASRETKELHLDLQNIKFGVVDGEGKAVAQPQVIDYGGRVAGPWTVRLAPGGSQRVDLSSRGLSFGPNLAAVLDLGPTFAWEFKPEQAGPFYLQARLEIPKDSKQPTAWSGRIELPKSKLPLPIKQTR